MQMLTPKFIMFHNMQSILISVQSYSLHLTIPSIPDFIFKHSDRSKVLFITLLHSILQFIITLHQKPI